MPRNLDHRIEVVTPVEDGRSQAELNAVLDAVFADNLSSWELRADGTWERRRPSKGKRGKTAQGTLMRRALARGRRAVRAR
jgi:polyphosphate kinase